MRLKMLLLAAALTTGTSAVAFAQSTGVSVGTTGAAVGTRVGPDGKASATIGTMRRDRGTIDAGASASDRATVGPKKKKKAKVKVRATTGAGVRY
jgi:hypothetical protein